MPPKQSQDPAQQQPAGVVRAGTHGAPFIYSFNQERIAPLVTKLLSSNCGVMHILQTTNVDDRLDAGPGPHGSWEQTPNFPLQQHVRACQEGVFGWGGAKPTPISTLQQPRAIYMENCPLDRALHMNEVHAPPHTHMQPRAPPPAFPTPHTRASTHIHTPTPPPHSHMLCYSRSAATIHMEPRPLD